MTWLGLSRNSDWFIRGFYGSLRFAGTGNVQFRQFSDLQLPRAGCQNGRWSGCTTSVSEQSAPSSIVRDLSTFHALPISIFRSRGTKMAAKSFWIIHMWLRGMTHWSCWGWRQLQSVIWAITLVRLRTRKALQEIILSSQVINVVSWISTISG